MGRHCSGSSFTQSDFDIQESITTLQCPFGKIEALTKDELRETAYELFFTSCRSSPGFGGKHPLTFYSSSANAKGPSVGPGGSNMSANSKIKRALGLRPRSKPTPLMMKEASNVGPTSPGKAKQRPMTSAEIMRQQMGVTEQGDCRLRKTLMRAFVGQTERRAETIILPLELLRQLRPSEFSDLHEYHLWQRRQLKVLETGLVLHPLVPLDRPNPFAMHLVEVVRSGEHRPIDTGKNSQAMRTLCNVAPGLAWRASHTLQHGPDVCHWADGYPFNIHLYLSLLHSIFDQREETVVLDEVDELIELVKKTWPVLGIGRMTHNVCLTWVLFEQYVETGQVEPDLICAASTMLSEVANDAKKADKDPWFVKAASSALSCMLSWADKKLLNYHEGFENEQVGIMDTVLRLALSIGKIAEDIPSLREDQDVTGIGNRVDYYIRSSLRNAFSKAYENGNGVTEPNERLVQLAKETEHLAIHEKENFSPVLKRWHGVPAAVAVVTLHSCFGGILKQYMTKLSNLSNESIGVLQTAGKLEKVLVQMVVEDSVECEDGGKGIVREMVPYEVDTVIMNMMRDWISDRLRSGKECLTRVKETESWNPKSKSEPYAGSAVEIMKLAKATVDDFFQIPVSDREELIQDLADGLENLFQDYTCFVSSCGSKQNYVPALPPLTRCNRESTMVKFWQKAAAPCTCTGGFGDHTPTIILGSEHKPRPTTSRGTQRLYVRLNTLHYLMSIIHSIDKSLSRPPSTLPLPSPSPRLRVAPSHFDLARSSVQSAIVHVSEVAAYRLIFVDSAHQFYDTLYSNGVSGARLEPRLLTLKQNLTLLVAVLTDRAQALAVREVMKAAFEAFLMVLLAGGSRRWYSRSDYDMVMEDLGRLKRVFCAAGEGLVAEEVVEREAEVVEGVVEMMGVETERLIEDFVMAACEASGIGGGVVGGMQKVPMPSTTGRWSRSDPNTVLRVLCQRNDEVASGFLKKAFQLPKRK